MSWRVNGKWEEETLVYNSLKKFGLKVLFSPERQHLRCSEELPNHYRVPTQCNRQTRCPLVQICPFQEAKAIDYYKLLSHLLQTNTTACSSCKLPLETFGGKNPRGEPEAPAEAENSVTSVRRAGQGRGLAFPRLPGGSRWGAERCRDAISLRGPRAGLSPRPTFGSWYAPGLRRGGRALCSLCARGVFGCFGLLAALRSFRQPRALTTLGVSSILKLKDQRHGEVK